MKTILFLILLLLTSLDAKERIVSLSPSITEILYALKKGDQLVATSSYSLYPKEVQKLPVIGSYQNPNIEKILSFKPTLVIGQSFNSKVLEQLKHFRVKTLQVRLKTLTNIEQSIQSIADATNANNAHTLIQKIEDALKQTKNNFKNKKVMIVYGLHTDLRGGIYIAGQDIFFNDIIKECGGQNAFRAKLPSQPVLNYENVIALNPDIIIILHSLATESSVDVALALKAWKQIPTNASQSGNIYILDDDYLHIPSQRVSQSIQKICGVLDD